MPSPRLRRTARALLADGGDRLLLARHDLTARHYGRVLWAPPGGGLEPGETPVEAVLRELEEELGLRVSADRVRHVWHQEVVSAAYSKDWDGAVHDYFLVHGESWAVRSESSADLQAAEGITEFRWWSIAAMRALAEPEVFAPRQLPALLGDLLRDRDGDRLAQNPVDI